MACLSALILCAYMLAFPAECISRAGTAMELWARAVAPALFPFMALLPVLSGESARRGYGRAFGFIMKPLFRLPGEAAAPAVVGLLGGSPAGAIAIRRAALEGALSPREALTAAVLSSGCSPVFLVCSAGAGMFGDAGVGYKLLACALSAQIMLAFIVSRLPERLLRASDLKTSDMSRASGASAVGDAVAGTLTVCGWMVLFSVFGGALPAAFVHITEISAACARSAEAGNAALAAFSCGFGGLCAGCQNMSHLNKAGVNAIVYFVIKAICGFICYTLYALTQNMPNIGIKTDMLTAGIILSSLSAALTLCVLLFTRSANTD